MIRVASTPVVENDFVRKKKKTLKAKSAYILAYFKRIQHERILGTEGKRSTMMGMVNVCTPLIFNWRHSYLKRIH